ncbi:MAG: 2Fe-2S iron-sulfur cluster-binding protein [Marmoricola sp.]
MPLVTVEPTGEEIFLPEGETVLGGLFAAGYAYTVGCRRGGCGICMADLQAGTVTYNRTVADEVLSEDDKAAGACLTCRAVPQSDITITLREGTLRLIQPWLQKLNQTSRERAEAVCTATDSEQQATRSRTTHLKTVHDTKE